MRHRSRDVYGLLCSVWCACLIGTNGIFNQTLEPTPQTAEPTPKPTHFPTRSPTDYPVVSIDDGYVIVIEASVPVKEINPSEVAKELEYLELLFADSAGLDFNEVDISIKNVGEKASTVADECNATIVSGINYEVISDDNTTYTYLRQNLGSGAFIDSYNTGLSNVFDEDVSVCPEDASSIIEEYTQVKYDDAYPPDKDPSITEQLWSEYLFFGFFTSLLGVVWLWYLRSEVDDDNIYVGNNNNGNNSNNNNNNNNGGTNTGIEMQPKQAPKGTTGGNSSNPLLNDDGTTGQNTKLSDYAVQNEDGQLVLDQRDSQRSP